MKRKLLQILSAAAMGAVTTIIANPEKISEIVPPPYQAPVGVTLAILGMLLPSVLPQGARTKLWGSQPEPEPVVKYSPKP